MDFIFYFGRSYSLPWSSPFWPDLKVSDKADMVNKVVAASKDSVKADMVSKDSVKMDTVNMVVAVSKDSVKVDTVNRDSVKMDTVNTVVAVNKDSVKADTVNKVVMVSMEDAVAINFNKVNKLY